MYINIYCTCTYTVHVTHSSCLLILTRLLIAHNTSFWKSIADEVHVHVLLQTSSHVHVHLCTIEVVCATTLSTGCKLCAVKPQNEMQLRFHTAGEEYPPTPRFQTKSI